MTSYLKLLCKVASSIALIWLMLPARILADVSIVAAGTRTGSVPKFAWTSRLQIKGFKLRVDSEKPPGGSTYIYDLESGKRYRLDSKKREVFVMDLEAEDERIKGFLMLDKIRKVVKPTGRQLEVAGFTCDEYSFDLQAPSHHRQGVGYILHDHGTVCVSQIIPGGTELTTYIHEAQKRGYLSGATNLSPSDSPLGIYFYGAEPNVLVLSANAESGSELPSALGLGNMGILESKKAIISINTDPIPDDNFQIPSDWKVKKESLPH